MTLTDQGTRRHDRVRTRLLVQYGPDQPDRSDYVESVSEGGLCINTNRVYKVGTRLVLQIEFPGRIVSLRGEVAWAIQVPEHLRESMVCGMGVHFLDAGRQWTAYFREWQRSRDASG